MGSIVEQPTRKTPEELMKEAEAEEAAIRKAQAEQEEAAIKAKSAESQPEPTPQADKPAAPTPDATNTAEIEKLKAEVADRDAKLAEITKRLRDEDGKRGGELGNLRDQVEKLGAQLRELMAENRELRKPKPDVKPEPPPEPDDLEKDFPAVAEGVDKRVKKVSDGVKTAQETAEQTRRDVLAMREAGFMQIVQQAVPNLDQHNKNPAFLDWCGGMIPGTRITRQQALDDAHDSFDAPRAIELIRLWEAEENGKRTPDSAPSDKPKGDKPSKEAQVEVPKSAGPGPKQPANSGLSKRRYRELEDKIFKWGTATKEDREEYDRLVEAEAEGKLT